MNIVWKRDRNLRVGKKRDLGLNVFGILPLGTDDYLVTVSDLKSGRARSGPAENI